MKGRSNTPDHQKMPQPSVLRHSQSESFDSSAFTPGQMIQERYKVIELLGRGGMGSVYRVEQVFLRKQFALKTINPYRTNEQALKRFHKEARAASLLEHPGLIKVHDFGLENDRPWFVMDLVDGQTLDQKIRIEGKLTIAETLPLFAQIAEALAHAHTEGILHRDLKPSNIMVLKPDNGRQICKIVDFGIAKLQGLDETNQLTQTGEIFGSPQYMSPEQCLGTALDHRSDIYSFGCVLFETLVGVPPFKGETALAVMLKHQSEAPPTLRAAAGGKTFPEDLEKVVAKLLRKNPSERFESLLLVANNLRRIAEDKTIPTMDEDVRARPSSLHPRSEAIKATAITVGLLLAGFGTGQIAKFFAPAKVTPKPKIETVETRQKAVPIDEQIHEYISVHLKQNEKYSHEIAGGREFSFPFEFGSLTIQTHQLSGETPPVQWLKMDGSVKIVPFKTLDLNLNALGMDYPGLLEGFNKDEIGALRLAHAGSGPTPQPVLNHILSVASTWTNLDTLCISKASVEDINVSSLKELPHIRVLDARHMNIDGNKLAQIVGSFDKLRTLRISDNSNITDALKTLQNNESLEHLSVSRTGLRDSDLAVIAKIKNLDSLRMNDNPAITKTGLASLKTLSKLTFIRLGTTEINPQDLAVFSKFPRLQSIMLTNVRWTSAQKAEAKRFLRPDQQVEFDGSEKALIIEALSVAETE